MVLCAGAFGCYAAQGSLPGAQGQGYDLNLSYSRTTLKAVADAITQQVGIAFSYETALAGYPMENLEVSEKGATIEAILAAVFTPRGIDYRVVDKVVVLTRSTRPVPAASAAAKSEVKGVVRDAAGNPMIGVTVTIKGTLVGVSTGVDGGYAIPADGNATLLFSYIGYRPHEEVVGRRTQIDVTMQEDELVMDEVVVVGYGTLKKRNIVGAVENLSGDAVENRPNANITRSLQGQIPGLNIVQVDGKADHAGEVTIRGVNNTFKARVSGGEKTNKLGQGGGALVLIDGAEGDMGSVNPDDIASISVLKDASSAAVYGARGAFGVILITTKDPEKGKVRVSYNGSVSLHRRTVIWEDNVVTDPVQWVDAFRESYLNSSPTATVPSLFNNYMPYSNAWFEELKRRRADPTMDNYDIDANGNYNYYGETNWLKEIYKSVNYSTTHAVSIQGGREGVSYYISGRYYNQDGIYKVGEETYKKYNLRAKGSIRIRPWLTLDNNTSLMSSKYHQPMVHYGQQVISRQIDMFAFPFALLKNPDGTWTQTAAKTGYAAFAEGTSWQENNKLEVANTTTFNFEFVPDVFKVSADVTYKGSRWSRDRMENLYTYYTGVNVSGQDNSYSSLENWTYRSDYISTNIVGTVTPKLGADHDLNVVAGWNLEDYDYRTQKTYRQGNLYPSKPSFTLMDGEYYSTTSGGYTWGLVGFFGRVNYAYAGRYLAEVSARYDGSSKFPSSSQWGFFPSASVGWRLSEEPWLKPHVEGWLDNFKVRASIGSLGNANIDPYQYLETMTASGSASIAKSSVIINGQNVPYTSVPSLIPDDITWEKVTTYNIGLDLDLFHNRLSFTGDYYRRNTTDLYTVGPNLPQVLGSAAPYGNYASLKTKGWELSLSWRDSFNLGGKPFSYSIKGMLWDSRSWITDYYNETGDLTTYYKGMEIGEIWGFRTAGIYASNADALNGPAYNFFKNGEMFRAYAGDLRFVDVDGDGIMTKGNRTLSNHGDLEIIGNQSPRYQYSINMSLNWNGIGLSMLWQGVGKRDWYPWTESGFFWGKWNRAYNSLMKTQTGDNVVRIDKSTDNWRVTNMDKNPYWTRMVSLAANRNDGPLTWENDHYLQDASYIRLKNITIDYTFPKHICKKLRLEGLKVYLSGENLFTHSPMFKHTDMFDPEVITSGDSDFAASTTSGGYTWGLVGFFGRVNYAYAGRYLAEVSARYDGSSKFPSSSQWGFFPSASVGWRLSEEPWLKPHVEGWLDNFKVRASIGSLGNANIDPYQYLETMTASGSASIAKSSVIINGQNVPYTSVPSLIPDDITWEKVTTYNIGLDLDLFHNRLSFTGDYYRRNTTDLYTVGPNLPQVLGSAAPYGNYASLKTKGWELSLSWRDSFNLGGKPFSYSIKGMLWDSRSWITDYYNETGDLTTYYKGMEIGEIWGFRTAGIYASNADALNGPAYNFFKNGEMFRAYAGDLRFVDVDGDGIMTKGNRTLSNHGDLEIIGNQSPRYQYSINMSLNWNGIGLSMLWQGVGKRDWYPWTESGFFWGKWNRAYNSLMKTQTGDNVVRIDKSTDNWRVTNMDKNPYWTRMVSLAANRNDGPLTWENDHYLQDASYIRLKNITIDYTFPKHICKKLRLEGLKVYLSGENLFTHSPMFKHTDMFDPEVITSGDSDFAASTTSGLNGTGNGYSYPMLKTVTLGINVTF